MKVCEIYSALQGEGRYTGYATTFIQEPIDLAKGTDWSIDRILSKVNKLGNRHVCIKGETLLQEDSYTLVYELLAYSYIVTMETSCRIPLEDCLYDRTYAYNVIINCANENILNFIIVCLNYSTESLNYSPRVMSSHPGFCLRLGLSERSSRGMP